MTRKIEGKAVRRVDRGKGIVANLPANCAIPGVAIRIVTSGFDCVGILCTAFIFVAEYTSRANARSRPAPAAPLSGNLSWKIIRASEFPRRPG